MKESSPLPLENDPEFKHTLSVYQEIVKTGKTTYLAKYEFSDLASYFFDKNDEENLIKVFELNDSFHPDNIGIMYTKTRYFLRIGKLDKALAAIEWLKEMADSYTREGANEDEIIAYRNEIILNTRMLQAELSINKKQLDLADDYFLQAYNLVTDKEDKAYVAVNAAAIYASIGDDDDRIKTWIERSLQAHPQNEAALELLSFYYSSHKNLKKAEEILNKLVDENPYSTRYWRLMGDTYVSNDDFEKAIEAYDFALAIDENDMTALKKKAISFLHLNNYEKAYQFLTSYLQKVPDDYNAVSLSALCLASMEQFQEAIDILEKIMKETNNGQDDPTVNQDELFNLIVRTYRLGKFFDKAMEWADKAIECEVNKSFYYTIKGGIYLELKENKNASHYFSLALQTAENKILALTLVANEYFIFQDYATSKIILFEIHERPAKYDFPTVTGMLAYCCLQLEEYDEYLNYLKESCLETPKETKVIFYDIIPDGMTLEDFYTSEEKKYR